MIKSFYVIPNIFMPKIGQSYAISIARRQHPQDQYRLLVQNLPLGESVEVFASTSYRDVVQEKIRIEELLKDRIFI